MNATAHITPRTELDDYRGRAKRIVDRVLPQLRVVNVKREDFASFEQVPA